MITGLLIVATSDCSNSSPIINYFVTAGEPESGWSGLAQCHDKFIRVLDQLVDGDIARSDVSWIELPHVQLKHELVYDGEKRTISYPYAGEVRFMKLKHEG